MEAGFAGRLANAPANALHRCPFRALTTTASGVRRDKVALSRCAEHVRQLGGESLRVPRTRAVVCVQRAMLHRSRNSEQGPVTSSLLWVDALASLT